MTMIVEWTGASLRDHQRILVGRRLFPIHSQSDHPWRGHPCNMMRYRRGACLQYRPGSLQRGDTQEAGILGWPRRSGVSRTLFRHRSGQRHTTGWQVLAIRSDGQLIPDGLSAPRGHLWHWTSGSIQPQRQYPVLPESPSVRVLKA